MANDAMQAIEKENKRLKGVLPEDYARDELDKLRLGNVVDLFTNVQTVEHSTDKYILGRTYEYCLAKFAKQEGKRTGELYTQFCVIRTLVEFLQAFKGRIYDSCCGSGGIILTPGRYVGIEEQEDDGEPFEEKIARLVEELSGMFKRSRELEEEIRKKLGAIEFEV